MRVTIEIYREVTRAVETQQNGIKLRGLMDNNVLSFRLRQQAWEPGLLPGWKSCSAAIYIDQIA